MSAWDTTTLTAITTSERSPSLGVLATETIGIAMALLGLIPLAVLGARTRQPAA